MATYLELRTRIISEMNRDDLADELATQLATHIAQSCEYYADERFWFNAIVTTAPTTGGVETVAVPATVRRIDKLTIAAQYAELQEITLPQFEEPGSTSPGQPSQYAYYNDAVKLWPIPDGVYSLQFTGLKQIDAPVADSDTNEWTTEAYDLIVAHTKMRLYRGQFRDPEGAQMAKDEALEAFNRLKRETAKRLATPLRPTNPMWSRPGFSIARG